MERNEFGRILKELRLADGLSQRSLGNVLSVNNQTVSFWETGSREPDLDTLVRLCKYFKVSADYLLGMSILE
ncbi:MAG: helix-turn-helix domain-containing protein [Clostridiales bacterium]|jgi:transcriptional regulator with XRE-family HTH domain|nr:helix-turn-helix domain-containing protein [Clostridiales bacterium]